MRIGESISKDVKLASKSCNVFWWMLQFISDTPPSLSATSGAQDHATGLHARMSQDVLPRLGGKELLASHSTAGLGQHSWAKMKRRINPSSSRDQIPQKDTVVLDFSQQQHRVGLMPELARFWGEHLHAHVMSCPSPAPLTCGGAF